MAGRVLVVQHEDDRRLGGRHLQESDDGIEQGVALGVRVGARGRGQIGHFVGKSGNKRKQGFDATHAT